MFSQGVLKCVMMRDGRREEEIPGGFCHVDRKSGIESVACVNVATKSRKSAHFLAALTAVCAPQGRERPIQQPTRQALLHCAPVLQDLKQGFAAPSDSKIPGGFF